MRGDTTDGIFYFKLDSKQLGNLNGRYRELQAWIWSGDAMSEQTGMTYALAYGAVQRLSDESPSQLPQMLKAICPLNSVAFTTTDYLELLNTICGDSHFVKSGPGSEAGYSAHRGGPSRSRRRGPRNRACGGSFPSAGPPRHTRHSREAIR